MFNVARFRNEDAAREHIENLRWPNGAVCPHCGGTERNSRLRGESHRTWPLVLRRLPYAVLRDRGHRF